MGINSAVAYVPNRIIKHHTHSLHMAKSKGLLPWSVNTEKQIDMNINKAKQ